MLTEKERRYFESMRNYILRLFNLRVGVYPADHHQIIPMREGEEVLGCCHKISDSSGDNIGYVITIDIPYIKACYYGRQAEYSPYSDNQLIETICHEIAHLYIWDHSNDHKELTNELYNCVIDSLKINTKIL